MPGHRAARVAAAMTIKLPPTLPEPYQALVLKDELCTRVEIVAQHGRRLLVKTYRNRPFLLWRTLLLASRAAREYRSLRRLFEAGAPCIEPVWFDELRVGGCVPWSRLATVFVEDHRSVRDLLADRCAPALRRSLAIRIGRTLRRVHDAGVLWGTPSPRNFLAADGGEDGELLACDMPGAVHARGSIAGTTRALIDLFDACFSRQRRRDFSATDRAALLLEYAAGDRTELRRLWRLLSRRSPAGNRARKGLLRTLHTYLLGLVSAR